MFITDAIVSVNDPKPRARGPLDKLEIDKYATGESLVYPLVLRESTRNDSAYKHYIRFNINIPEKSKYSKTGVGGGLTDNVSAADWNRARDGNQFGSSTNPLGIGIDGGVSAAAVGGLVGGLHGLDAIAKLGKGDTAGAFGSVFNAVKSVSAAGVALVDVTRKTKRLVQSITLYVPDLVQQTVVNKYDEVSLTDALGKAGFAAAAVQSGKTISASDLFDEKNMTFGKGGSVVDAVGAELAGKIASTSGSFGNNIEKVALASAGVAINPQVEVLFTTVSNRTFQFDFKFHPRSQDEAQEVLAIIKAFKFHSAPELVQEPGGGRYFIPPSEFDIQYMFNGKENQALPKISTCVLEGIDINYAQGGQFTTFDDGIPVDIYMVLKFKEVEIIHKDRVVEGY